MLNTILKIAMAAMIVVGLFIVLGASFIQSAGNALLSSTNGTASAHGLAQLVPASQGNASILQVRLDGLPANQNYGVSLDQSRCGGPVYSYAGTMTTDSNGTVLKNFTLTNARPTSQNQLWLNVNQASGASVVCGQVQVNDNLLSRVTSSTTNATQSNGGVTAFPQTGVAPGKHGVYNNHIFPRKY